MTSFVVCDKNLKKKRKKKSPYKISKNEVKKKRDRLENNWTYLIGDLADPLKSNIKNAWAIGLFNCANLIAVLLLSFLCLTCHLFYRQS